MRKIFKKYELEFGNKIPKGYGIAYYDIVKQLTICYPIPFNYIIRIIRNITYKFKSIPMSTIERNNQYIYNKGFIDGYNYYRKAIKKIIEKYMMERGMVIKDE